jgi:hypothetical protein
MKFQSMKLSEGERSGTTSRRCLFPSVRAGRRGLGIGGRARRRPAPRRGDSGGPSGVGG